MSVSVERRALSPPLSLTLLVAILAVAAFLRFEHLGEPSYWLDEVLSDLGVTTALEQPWWRWPVGFDSEHGPLSFAVQLSTRAIGRDPFAGRLPAALFGLATVALVVLVERRASARRPFRWAEAHRSTGTVAAAALLALSPLHVYYSREARPYALLILLTAALIVALLRESRWFYAVLIALLYTTAVAAPVVASAAVAALLVRRYRFAIAAGAVTLAFPLLYRGGPSSHPDAPFPHLDAAFFGGLLKGLTVSALGADIDGRTMLALCALALIGAVAMFRRERVAAIVIVAMTVLPVVLAIASLMLFNHWFALRYICPAVIGFVVLAGAGIVFITRKPAIALILTAVICWQTWDTVRREPYQKLDWRRIAATIARYAKPGDLILAAEPSTGLMLPYHLLPYGRNQDVIQMSIPPLAQRMLGEHPATWLVTSGTNEGAVRKWMCRYPLVLASQLDGFRMHYSGDFLRERAQAPEFRALDAAIGARGFSLAMDDGTWFRDGWAIPEGYFRWAVGNRSDLEFPRWGQRDRIIRVHVLPMDHPSLPRQTMRVSVNGNVIGETTLANAWTEQTFAAPARVWRNGMNMLSFTFGRAVSPASLDPAAHDERPLAVSFDRIEVADSGAAGFSPPNAGGLKPAAPQGRIASAFIDEKTAWRNTPPRLPGAQDDALVGRLGFDPTLARGIDLDDLATSLAAGSDCEDDRGFITRVYAAIFERAPTDPEMASLLAKREKGDSRETLVRHLMKSPELRAALRRR